MPSLLAPTAAPASPSAATPWPAQRGEPRLHSWESARLEAAPWFSGLSPTLRQAVLARSRVRHVARGALLVRRGDAAADWLGVASGALRLGSVWPDGRAFSLELLSPGEWYGDIALLDGSPADLDIHAHVPSTLLLCPKAELQALLQQSTELQQAFQQLNCRRLRHMFRRLEELQTLPLAQRVALQLQRLLRGFGRAPVGSGAEAGIHIDLSLTQGDLADLLCASRQRINGVLRRMQAAGVLTHQAARITVFDECRLASLAQGRETLPLPHAGEPA
jgi:CRP/FNR family transcriptional regulator, cyclic AMP receptor protein